jgi:type II secretion system (T2SS) protein F
VTGPLDPLVAGCGMALMLRYPWLVAVMALPKLNSKYRVLKSRRAALRRAESDPMIVGRVVQVGLAGGLPLASSLALAVGEVGELVADELTATLRTARREGIASAMAAFTGPRMKPFFSRITLAQASGAPMQDAVAAYLIDRRAERRSRALEQLRRLPISLMVPLGLLILPGFVVLFVGPIVLNSLMDLSGSLP